MRSVAEHWWTDLGSKTSFIDELHSDFIDRFPDPLTAPVLERAARQRFVEHARSFTADVLDAETRTEDGDVKPGWVTFGETLLSLARAAKTTAAEYATDVLGQAPMSI